MEKFRSRLHYACATTNDWIKDLWNTETCIPFAIGVTDTYPVWSAVFYLQSHDMLRKDGKFYTTTF